mmetsp:Transcript_71191/g.123562  ORF Transcript_71191/g.123562 Transcript_71191/m.123562 type:complete len:613 (+) Transcript_71191:54-1892(+)
MSASSRSGPAGEAQPSLEELLAQLDREDLAEKTALKAHSDVAGDDRVQLPNTEAGNSSSSLKWTSLEKTLAGLEQDEVEHTVREEQHAFRAIGNTKYEEDSHEGTRLKMLRKMKPDVDWQGIMKAMAPAPPKESLQPRELPEGQLSAELDRRDVDTEGHFERTMMQRVARSREEKKALQQRRAQLSSAPSAVPRGGLQVGPQGRMPKSIGLSAGSRLSGRPSGTRSYPVPTFTPLSAAAADSEAAASEAPQPQQQQAAAKEKVKGKQRSRATGRTDMVNGLPAYDEICSEDDLEEELPDLVDPDENYSSPEQAVWEDHRIQAPQALDAHFPVQDEQADENDPDIQQASGDPLEKLGLKNLSRLLIRDAWATKAAEEKKAEDAVQASKETEIVLPADVDLCFQWVYTDAEAGSDSESDSHFVLEILRPLKNNTLEARFLDDGVPTSAKVTCTIEDAEIVIEEKHKYTKTTYRGTLSRNKKQITGRWADRKKSNSFTLTKTLSIRDFCFHWQYSNTSAGSSLIFSVWEDENSRQPRARCIKDGSPIQAEVGCTVTHDYIRFDEASGSGWTRYEGKLAKNGRSISGTWTDRAGASQAFKLDRLSPSFLELSQDSA